jgi:hypothetical protein
MQSRISISRPRPDEHSAYYGAYIARVDGDDAGPALESQLTAMTRTLGAFSESMALHRYAPGKWSVKEVVGHLCDSERVFAYRALRFARADATPLPGFEEDLYVPAGRFDARPLPDLLDELQVVRSATLSLFRSFDEVALSRRGIASDRLISVRALAWVVAGHVAHHAAVLRDRYGVDFDPAP